MNPRPLNAAGFRNQRLTENGSGRGENGGFRAPKRSVLLHVSIGAQESAVCSPASPIFPRKGSRMALPCQNRRIVMPQSADKVLDHAPLFREPEYQDMLARKKAEFECMPRPPRSRKSPTGPRPGNIARRISPAASLVVNPGQGLPAARRGLRRRRLREDHVLRAWLAGLRRLLPLASVAPLQGAVLGGLLVDDRGRGGVRRPAEHDRRPGQHLFAVPARR